jgi:hypothetical protein
LRILQQTAHPERGRAISARRSPQEMTTDEKLDLLLAEVAVLTEKVEAYERRIAPLSDLVVKAEDITKTKGLSNNAVSANGNLEKYVVPTKRKVLLSLESVQVLGHRKRRKNHAR